MSEEDCVEWGYRGYDKDLPVQRGRALQDWRMQIKGQRLIILCLCKKVSVKPAYVCLYTVIKSFFSH